MAEAAPRAALLIIGNEILSGRTQDTNLRMLATSLNARGISLAETRVVRDDETAIVEAVNSLRATYDHLFTSGGIGPTHDDITTDCVAKAFGVEAHTDPDAAAQMKAHYAATGREATEARMRMARVPIGAQLIRSESTPAPGFQVENVYVLAGVPFIFAEMVANIVKGLPAGPARQSRTVTVDIGESEVANDLEAVQNDHPELELGSYPQQDGDRYYAELVISGTDENAIAAAMDELTARLDKREISWRLD